MKKFDFSYIAEAISDGKLIRHWKFYIVFLIVSVIGSASGSYITAKYAELAKGEVSKDVWLAQETWKERYRLYTILIKATEEIAASLFSIISDVRTIPRFPPGINSTEQDGLQAFPEHKVLLESEAKAIGRICDASAGAELLLNKKAIEALEKIKNSRTRSYGVLNLSYFQRIQIRCDAASEAKMMLIEAARQDLKIK